MPAEKPQNSSPYKKGIEARVEARIDVSKLRISATFAVLYGNRTSGFLVEIKDFSKSGAGLYSRSKVDPGTAIRLSIDGLDNSVIEGRVVWCGSATFDPAAPPTHPFRIGVEFAPKDDAARETQIRSFVHLTRLASQSGA